MSAPRPTELRLQKRARQLVVVFADGRRFELPFEYLRVFSPSAEVRGHGLPEPILLLGKENVQVTRVEPVGQYAVRLVFDDGHDSGIYSWPVLRELGENFAANWQRYLERLAKAGIERHPQ